MSSTDAVTRKTKKQYTSEGEAFRTALSSGRNDQREYTSRAKHENPTPYARNSKEYTSEDPTPYARNAKEYLSKQSSESPSQYKEKSGTNVILQSTRRSIEKDNLWCSVCDNFRCM
jgi:hypothetical protein